MRRRSGGLSRHEIGYMREAGLVVVKVHEALRAAVAPGVTTKQLDQVAYEATIAAGAKPNFLGYGGFPASVCISVDDEIVHGIPGDRVLEPGDIVSFDCGAVIERAGLPWHSDAAFTVVLDAPPEVVPEQVVAKREQLSHVTKEALWAGIASAAGAKYVGEIGAAVQDEVAAQAAKLGWEPDILEGYSGHGIGNALHQDPQVYNYRTRSKGPRIHPGMVLCIEPMLTEGKQTSRVLEDDWTVVTVDGLVAAHWEHTVAILEDGISVLTAPDFGAHHLEKYGIVPITSFD